ncbi:alpha/beta fold hydrolase [Nocardia sp. SYP-A9097]|uniref:alpha/beta hydrolase family protein n=1 Tax=Nocardia sp. SYP-A9097 TaxID=2663237 RepID=UPI00129B45C0|nr:alpha/beta fold hydrolase [Nocardia sp. SYP-A9097]MRH87559.1 alpha/beta fold hydrolase [Nocardia sp. SYP-A9097]
MAETDPVAIATTVAEWARDERFTEIEELFAPRLRAVVSAETVGVAWTARVGTVQTIGAAATEPLDGELVRVSVPVNCERGELTLVVSVDSAGQLHGIRLAPPAGAWEPPGYATPKRFTEQEVSLETDAGSVPGTLTLPRGRGPFPGAVLLASGPTDRDQTVGPNKPFKDLAWGLASRGIAVLRFDKLNFVHGQLATAPDFTMVEEYLPTTIAAVHTLQQHSSVDPAQVYVVGHSGGGKAAPRVAAAEPSIAGVVIMAGDTVPLPIAAVRVANYLAALDPGPHTTATLESITAQAAAVENPDLSLSTPTSELLFGWPAAYWLDLRTYHPAEAAAALNKPTLLLQGTRDYQVTVHDDLPAWQQALATNPEARITLYPTADHMFFPGTGPSTPTSYQSPNHVAPTVITDIANWLTRTRPRNPPTRLISKLRR